MYKTNDEFRLKKNVQLKYIVEGVKGFCPDISTYEDKKNLLSNGKLKHIHSPGVFKIVDYDEKYHQYLCYDGAYSFTATVDFVNELFDKIQSGFVNTYVDLSELQIPQDLGLKFADAIFKADKLTDQKEKMLFQQTFFTSLKEDEKKLFSKFLNKIINKI